MMRWDMKIVGLWCLGLNWTSPWEWCIALYKFIFSWKFTVKWIQDHMCMWILLHVYYRVWTYVYCC